MTLIRLSFSRISEVERERFREDLIKRTHTTSRKTGPGVACNFPQPALLIKKREGEREREREKRSSRNRISVTALGRGIASSSRRMHVLVNAANMISVELHFVPTARMFLPFDFPAPRRIRSAASRSRRLLKKYTTQRASCHTYSISNNLLFCERTSFSIFNS